MIRSFFNFEMFALLACIGVLLACGSGPQSSWSYRRLVRDQTRGDLVAVTCEGTRQQCYFGAAKACPLGFQIEDGSGHTSTGSKGYITTLPNGQVQGFSKSESRYGGDLLVRCVVPNSQAVAQ